MLIIILWFYIASTKFSFFIEFSRYLWHVSGLIFVKFSAFRHGRSFRKLSMEIYLEYSYSYIIETLQNTETIYTNFSPWPVLYVVIFNISRSLMMCLSVNSPHPAITIFSVGFPLLVPSFSIFSTTAYPLITFPKTTCFLIAEI